MKIYHGTSYRNIKRFDLNHAREKTDFGKGVYFGIDLNLAKRASCKARKMGAVYECDLDLKLFNVFECSGEDFIYTVYLCRLGLEDIAEDAVDNFEKADIIMGEIMSENIRNFNPKAGMFNCGQMDYDEFSKKFKTMNKDKIQLCIKSEKALNYVNSNITNVYYTRVTKDGKITAERRNLQK